MTGKSVFQLFLAFVILIFLVWLAFYFLVAALVIGLCVAAFIAARRFLIQKGIITPPPAATGDVTVIEVDYQEIDRKE